MAIDPKGFPLDLTGKNPRNEVTGEVRTLSSNEEMTFVPDGGPFFTDTLIVRSGTRVLRPVVDYKCLHLLKDATIESGLDVSAIIHIIDTGISRVTLQYQVIGGEYGNTVPAIKSLLDNADVTRKGVNWNTQVYAKPDVFPPAPHFVAGSEFSNWNDVVIGIDNIHRAIAYKDRASWNAVYTYVDNLINNRIGAINLTSFYTKSEVNALTDDLAPLASVYTKAQANSTFYTKAQVDSLIGDIDGNENYYTENEIDAKFVERTVADGTYATLIDFNKLDTNKVNYTDIYTRAQSDDRYADKTTVYTKTYIDANFTPVDTSFSKRESDTRYARVDASYTKPQSDQRYALKSQIPQAQDLTKFPTRDEVDNRYLKSSTADITYLRKSTADATYAKHSDLDIIDELNSRFNHYYTKAGTDDKFVSKSYLKSTYNTASEIAQTYGTKDWVSKVFLTQTNANSKFSNVNSAIDKKMDIVQVKRDYATTKYVVDTYYDKNTSDSRYYLRGQADNKFPTKHEVSRDLEKKVSIVNLNSIVKEVNENISKRLTIASASDTYYTKSKANSLFVTKNTHDSAMINLTSSIDQRATTSYVSSNYYTRDYINSKFATKSHLSSNYYSSAYLNSQFLRTSVFNSSISNYATSASVNKSINQVASKLKDYYTKSDSDARYYTIYEADSKFTRKTDAAAESQRVNEAISSRASIKYVKDNFYTKSHISKTYSTISYVDSNFYKSSYVNSEFLRKTAFNSAIGKYVLKTDLTAAISGVSSKFGGYYTKSQADDRYYTIYNADRTFMKIGEVNSKISELTGLINTKQPKSSMSSYATRSWVSSVYATKSQLGSYLTRSSASSTYLTKNAFNTYSSETSASISKKADKSYVDSKFYTRSQIHSGYYSKSYVNSTYEKKSDAAATYNTKATFEAFTAKAALKTDLSSAISNVNKTIGTKASTDYVRNTFQYKSSMSNYYTKSESDRRYLTISNASKQFASQKWANDRFATKEVSDSRFQFLTSSISTLRDRFSYKIGDLYLTTKHFTTSSQVASHLGYGSWTRYAVGRALVGYSPNGWVDGKGRDSSAKPFYYNSFTARMGGSWGSFEHTLTVNEMPNHRHSIGGYGGTSGGGGAAAGHDRGTIFQSDPVGGGQPHPNSQPSVTIGVWKRVA